MAERPARSRTALPAVDADAAHEAEMEQLLAQVASRLASRSAPSLRRVFNLTGTGLRCGSLTPKTAR